MKNLFVLLLLISLPNMALAATCSTDSSGNPTMSSTKTYTTCNAGYYLNNGSCIACPLGTYKTDTGTHECTKCKPYENGDTTIQATTTIQLDVNASGATSMAACYIPNTSTWLFENSTGSGEEKFTSNCYFGGATKETVTISFSTTSDVKQWSWNTTCAQSFPIGILPQTVDIGSPFPTSVTAPSCRTKSCLDGTAPAFLGWYSDTMGKMVYNASGVIGLLNLNATSDITLHAQWKCQ